ncbi:hypothetical protein AB0E01_01700 [Nocardia vinacea]|uniref:hypothetical protein n=1 Tax=Nocardia vinacea TaxID=96468 RepID=UPI0033ED3CA4
MKPKAVGPVRPDKSGLATPKHAIDVRRHAGQLGYRYLYTVRPPQRCPDPIGYVLGIAFGIQAAAVVIYDLETVDNTPARVCDVCDLETAIPPTTWAATLPGFIDPCQSYPNHPLTVAESHPRHRAHQPCTILGKSPNAH